MTLRRAALAQGRPSDALRAMEGKQLIVLRLRGSGIGYQGNRRTGRRISEKQGIRGRGLWIKT